MVAKTTDGKPCLQQGHRLSSSVTDFKEVTFMLIRLDDKIWYYRNTPTPLPKILVCSHRYLLDEAGDLRGQESWECHARSRLCLLENSQCSDERHEHWPQSAPEVQLQSRSQALPWSFLKQEAQMCIKDENAIPPLSASLLICLTE